MGNKDDDRNKTCWIHFLSPICLLMPRLCHLPQYSYDRGISPPGYSRLRLVHGFRDPGSVPILGRVTMYGNPYLICIRQSLRMCQIDDCVIFARYGPPNITIHKWNVSQNGPNLRARTMNDMDLSWTDHQLLYIILFECISPWYKTVF